MANGSFWACIMFLLVSCKTTQLNKRGRVDQSSTPPIANVDLQPEAVDVKPIEKMDGLAEQVIDTTMSQEKIASEPLIPPPAPELPKECQGIPAVLDEVPNVPLITLSAVTDVELYKNCPYINATVLVTGMDQQSLELGEGFKDIRGGLIVRNSGAVAIAASKLVNITGSLVIQGNEYLAKASFPLLEKLDGQLQLGGRTGRLNGALRQIEWPKLKRVGGYLVLDYLPFDVDLSTFGFTDIGGLKLENMFSQSKVNFPLLETVRGHILLQNSPAILSLHLPLLKTLDGSLISSSKNGALGNPDLPWVVSLPALEFVGNALIISTVRPVEIDLPVLSAVTSDFLVSRSPATKAAGNLSLRSFKAPKLRSIQGSLGFLEMDLAAGQTLDLPVLQSIYRGLYIEGSQIPFQLPSITRMSYLSIQSIDPISREVCTSGQMLSTQEVLAFPKLTYFIGGLVLCNVKDIKQVVMPLANSRSTKTGFVIAVRNAPALESLSFSKTPYIDSITLQQNPLLAVLDLPAGVIINGTKNAQLALENNPNFPCATVEHLKKRLNDPGSLLDDGICK